MKSLIIAAALAAALAATIPAFAAGDREAIRPTRDDTSETIVLRLFDSQEEVVGECIRAGVWPGKTAEQVMAGHPAPGCNAYAPATHVCTILTLRPRYVEDVVRMENLGHETLHCFKGLYHGE